jgi:hypothetical protein
MTNEPINYVTESKASDCWCPHARAAADTAAINRYSDGTYGHWTQCVGAKCMAWRWQELDKPLHHYFKGHRPPDDNPEWATDDTGASVDDVTADEATANASQKPESWYYLWSRETGTVIPGVGYCGLAGAP